MSNSDSNPPAWLGRLSERFGRIKFPPGVIGKSSYVMIALLILWAFIVWRLPANASWYDPLLLIGVIATATVIWWVSSTQGWAQRNPGLAVLEGAQFLDYFRFELQAKGQLHLPRGPSITDPDRPPPPQITDESADE